MVGRPFLVPRPTFVIRAYVAALQILTCQAALWAPAATVRQVHTAKLAVRARAVATRLVDSAGRLGRQGLRFQAHAEALAQEAAEAARGGACFLAGIARAPILTASEEAVAVVVAAAAAAKPACPAQVEGIQLHYSSQVQRARSRRSR